MSRRQSSPLVQAVVRELLGGRLAGELVDEMQRRGLIMSGTSATLPSAGIPSRKGESWHSDVEGPESSGLTRSEQDNGTPSALTAREDELLQRLRARQKKRPAKK